MKKQSITISQIDKNLYGYINYYHIISKDLVIVTEYSAEANPNVKPYDNNQKVSEIVRKHLQVGAETSIVIDDKADVWG